MDSRWETELRNKMAAYSENEPEGLLDEIMRQMETSRMTAQPQRTRRWPVRIAIAAASAAAALLLFLTVPEERNRRIQEDLLSATTFPLPSSTPVLAAGYTIPDQIQPLADIGYAYDTIVFVCGGPELTTADENAWDTEGDDRRTTTGSSSSGRQESGAAGRETPDGELIPWKDLPSETAGRRLRTRPDRRFSAGIHMANLLGSSQSYSGLSTRQPAAAFSGIPVRQAVSSLPGAGLMLLTQGEGTNTEIHHRQPIRAGITFRYNITPRWGLETGAVYSYLSSSMESGDSRYSSTTRQELHYIGIPLRASYSFFNSRYLTIYASAGGMVEKCISGRASTDYSFKGETTLEGKREKISVKPLQWSANAAVGLQCNFTRYLGLYVEPGASYHFDDGSMVSTVYKDKPFNFDIEFGLRFSFE